MMIRVKSLSLAEEPGIASARNAVVNAAGSREVSSHAEVAASPEMAKSARMAKVAMAFTDESIGELEIGGAWGIKIPREVS